MAGKIITLKFAGVCRDCGTPLPAGTKAKWYGRGRVYGLECHEKPPAGLRRTASGELVDREGRTGWVASFPGGAEVFQNYKGRCEDAPCCGCCGSYNG
jgi:hypothetical protein